MGDVYPTVRLAAVQAAPVWLDRDATVAKACRLIEEAADNGAKVIGFPEGFIPGFPDWYKWFSPRDRQSMAFYKALFKNALEVRSPAVEALGDAARRTRTFVVVGVNERDPGTLGTLFNSQMFFGPDGNLLGVHRKLMPTNTERLVHAAGDSAGMRTFATPFGAIGGLICGENTNSLARFALLAQQERIHVASWPSFPAGGRNFESIDIRVRYHALEGRIFVISACGILDDDCLDAIGISAEQRKAMAHRGGHSGIVGPSGSYIAGPVDDSAQIVYGDADFDKIIEGKQSQDLTGHYNRFDLFTLQMRSTSREALQRIAPSADADGNHSPIDDEDKGFRVS